MSSKNSDQLSLFDNEQNERIKNRPPKPWRQMYSEYIRSARWKRKRAHRIYLSGGECESCGTSVRESNLEVHHLHYETLGRELMSDLEVLCKPCHDKADRARESESKQRASDALWEAQLNGWATKVYGELWFLRGYDRISYEFVKWLDKKEQRHDED